MVQQQMQQQQQQQHYRWMSSQTVEREQPEWARPNENGNIVPSHIQRLKSPPSTAANQTQTEQKQFATQSVSYPPPTNFGAQNHGVQGLRLQINTTASHMSTSNTRVN